MPMSPRRFGSGRTASAAWALSVTLTAGLSAGLATPAAAQNDCQLVQSRVLTFIQRGGPGETYFIGRPVISCEDGSRIRADSAVIAPPLRLSRLYGNVRFDEEGRTLTADSANYQTGIDRLLAWGRVILADSAGGSRMTGDTMIYLRQGDLRPEDHLTMLGRRVEATIVPRPRADPPDTTPLQPYNVIARRQIVIEGQRAFRARGDVEIVRDELRAFGDTAAFSEDDDLLRLSGRARAIGEQYELHGRALIVRFEGDQVRDILARRDARLDGEDVDLTAPAIRIFVLDQKLERLVAATLDVDSTEFTARPDIPERFRRDRDPRDEIDWTRATAVAEEFKLIADSIDVQTPGEVLDRVIAVGNAYGESYSRDSLNVEGTEDVIRNDWLAGDTIVATFVQAGEAGVDSTASPPVSIALPLDSLAVLPDSLAISDSVVADVRVLESPAADMVGVEPDSTTRAQEERYELRRLVAIGNARSLYRLQPSDSVAVPSPDARRLAVHYVAARVITIDMVGGEVQHMEVTGPARGIHLEPLAALARADSVTAAPDTMGPALLDSIPRDSVPTDSGGVADTTSVGAAHDVTGEAPLARRAGGRDTERPGAPAAAREAPPVRAPRLGQG